MNKNLILLLSIFVLISCSKKSSNDSDNIKINISNVTQNRQPVSSTFSFLVTLSKAASSEVSIDFKTEGASAVADKDFVSKTGTLKIAAGQTQGNINIEVKADSLRGADKLFYVNLSNPANASIADGQATGIIVDANGLYLPIDNTGYTTPTTYPGYTMVWSDEFDGRQVNTNNWTFETGNNNGWGNNELENYTGRTENAFVSNGNLIIEARVEAYDAQNYTSARMITKDKKVFKFGRIDIRAKLPKGKGIWPALWMLGNNIGSVGWPACGEIDIMEYLGHETNKVYGTLHWGTSAAAHASKGSSYVLPGGTFDQQFHVYSLIWKQDVVKVLVDDHEYFQLTKAEVSGNYPFNLDQFFIFNVAVGGAWPGNPDATTVFPQRMAVDYVRVFQ